ncbi:MAG: hypothetical protein ACJAZX_001438 [Rickettsiales bacterium]|jgi:hypothetical protein
MSKTSSVKFILISSLIALSSCALPYQNNDGPTEIRIVDLNGNATKPVKRFIPAGNAQIIEEQKAQASQSLIQSTDASSDKIPSQNNYNRPVIDNRSANAAPFIESATPNNLPEAISPIKDVSANIQDVNSASQLSTEQPVLQLDSVEIIPAEIVSYDVVGDQIIETEAVIQEAPILENSPKKIFKFKESAPKKAVTDGAAVSAKPKNKTETFVQIGSYSVKENADKALSESQKIIGGKIQETTLGAKKIYRVLLGPISKNTEKTILNAAKNEGYTDAFIVK